MAKPTEHQRNRVSDTLASFFTSQQHQVLGRIADGADDWWGTNWDDDLSSQLHPMMVDTAAESGDKTADHLGGSYNADQTKAYLEQVAATRAETINSTTRQQLQDQLDSDEPDPQHVFDVARDSRAPGIAFGLATFLAGFGTREAAEQHAYETGGSATKSWVTGDNPRPEHAAIDGETVGLDEDFSNGMPWPGVGAPEDSNCNCSIDVEVDVPSTQNRAAPGRFFARARPEHVPFRAEVSDNGVAVIRLYDVIDSWGGFWGISAAEVLATLDDLPASTTQIQLRLNSPGGETTEAIAILNALRSHPAEVVAIVDSMAASAASVIAAGADRLVMMPNSEAMIHDAWGICIGNDADMTKTADLLNHCSDNLASVYAAKAGGSVAEWRALMREETWFSDSEAVAAGLADEIADPKDYPMVGALTPGASVEPAFDPWEMFDLSPFKFQGRKQAPTPKTPVARASGHPSKEGDATMAFLDDVRERLGVTDAAADEATVLAALEEALDEQDPAPAAQIPDGMVVLDQAKYDELMAYAGQVQTLVDERAQNRRETIVMAAIRDGKIPPARKQHFMDYLAVDEDGGKAQLDALKPGLVPFQAKGVDDGGQAEVGDGKQPGWSDSLFPDIHPEQKAS